MKYSYEDVDDEFIQMCKDVVDTTLKSTIT